MLSGPAACQVRQLAELAAPDGAAFDQFGYSVAMARTTIVVGAPKPIEGGEAYVYVFVRSGGTWKLAAELQDGAKDDDLGVSVSISGDGGTIVVGAPDSASDGTAYVFVKPEGGWQDSAPTAALTVSGGQITLGVSVAISADGTTIVVGADDDRGLGPGAVYVFSKPASGWVNASEPTATLSSSSAVGLGNAVAISADGGTVAAGSIGLHEKGVAYVFTKPQAGWQSEGPLAELTGSDESFADAFATAIAVDARSDTVAVGSPGHGSAGTAYVFVRPGGGWQNATQNAELTVASRTHIGLGASLAATNSLILTGAEGAFIGKKQQGAVFAYVKPPSGWVNTSQPRGSVTSSDGASRDAFGASVAFSGNLGVVGAPQHTVNGNAEQGAAYIFAEQ
jgi:hypothetical protein